MISGRLDPVWKQTAERLPDQAFAKDVRMAKVCIERDWLRPTEFHTPRCRSTVKRIGSYAWSI